MPENLVAAVARLIDREGDFTGTALFSFHDVAVIGGSLRAKLLEVPKEKITSSGVIDVPSCDFASARQALGDRGEVLRKAHLGQKPV